MILLSFFMHRKDLFYSLASISVPSDTEYTGMGVLTFPVKYIENIDCGFGIWEYLQRSVVHKLCARLTLTDLVLVCQVWSSQRYIT